MIVLVIPAIEYVDKGWLDEPKDKKAKDAYAERGFVHVPASASHGGVIAKGGVRRDATLSLAALQRIAADDDAAQTLALRRYILGLSLVALTAEPDPYLRQGCNLVLNPDKPSEFSEVYRNGQRKPFDLNHDDAINYAKQAAEAYGVGQDQNVAFDKKKAQQDVKKKD